MALRIRIPGWVRGAVVPSDLYTYADDVSLGYSVLLNGEKVEGELVNGYFVIARKWKKGDKVSVHFDMEPRVVKAHAAVAADQGRIAVERGPVVYCAEWPDNAGFSIHSVLMNRHPQLTVIPASGSALASAPAIATPAQALTFGEDGRLVVRDVTLTLIPYFAWCHRGPGEMAVWLPQSLAAIGTEMSTTLQHNAFFQ